MTRMTHAHAHPAYGPCVLQWEEPGLAALPVSRRPTAGRLEINDVPPIALSRRCTWGASRSLGARSVMRNRLRVAVRLSLSSERTSYCAHRYALPAQGATFARKIEDSLIPGPLDACPRAPPGLHQLCAGALITLSLTSSSAGISPIASRAANLSVADGVDPSTRTADEAGQVGSHRG
jgi:hypothetical protein